ncbi:MAG TPA: thioredoxin fold domain-containing protein [Opitutaceae bacterium]|jgi:thiol-disulfide isomerase/thioredoxin
MKRFVIPIAACVLALPAVRSADSPSAFRALSYDNALRTAQQENKVLLIDFFTTWCGPCKLLDQTTWSDPGVQRLLGKNAIAIRLDAEKEVDLARRFSIRAYPTIVLIKEDGSEMDRLVGYRPAATFTDEFTSDLAGETGEARAREAVAKAASNPGRQLQARLELANQLARVGKNAEALKEYLWLYDVGMKQDPEFSGVRNSFLLDAIHRLSVDYPPAAAELSIRYDAAKRSLFSDSDARSAAFDVAAINRAYHRDDETLKLYDEMSAGDARRAGLGTALFRLFLERRRYAEAAAAQPASRYLVMLDQEISSAAKSITNPVVGDQFKRVIVLWALDEIEALSGAGQASNAQSVADRLRAFDPSPATATAIAARIKKATIPS